MNLGTILFIVFNIFFIKSYIVLFLNKDKRHKYQQQRERLEELRKIPVKTPEQQKEFIDLKYPKTRMQGKDWLIFIGNLILSIIILYFVYMFWNKYINIEIPLYITLIYAVVMPMIVNRIMRRFGLQQDDISVFF